MEELSDRGSIPLRSINKILGFSEFWGKKKVLSVEVTSQLTAPFLVLLKYPETVTKLQNTKSPESLSL